LSRIGLELLWGRLGYGWLLESYFRVGRVRMGWVRVSLGLVKLGRVELKVFWGRLG